MKSTGVVRRVDELGRIVIPIELRRTLDIAEKDALEIYVDGEQIILKKYELSNAKKLEKKFKIIVFRGNGLFRSVITPYIESKMLFTNYFDYILENVDNSYF